MDCEYKIPFPGIGIGCGYGTDMKPTCWCNTRTCSDRICPLVVREEHRDNASNGKEDTNEIL